MQMGKCRRFSAFRAVPSVKCSVFSWDGEIAGRIGFRFCICGKLNTENFTLRTPLKTENYAVPTSLKPRRADISIP
jgi:hypothetical protein